MAEQLFPTEDTFDFSGADEGALLYTVNGEDDPPGKKKKLRTIADVPAYTPPKQPRIQIAPDAFKGYEQAIDNFKKAENQRQQLEQASKFGYTTGEPGILKAREREFAAGALTSYQPTYNRYLSEKNTAIKSTAPLFNEIADIEFGDTKDITEGKGGISDLVVYDELGIPFIDKQKIVNKSRYWAGNFGGGAYTQKAIETFLEQEGNSRLKLFRAYPNIKKRIDAEAPEKTQKNVEQGFEKFMLPFTKNASAQTKAAWDLYNQSALKLNRQFEPLMADIGMDAVFKAQVAAESVINKIADNIGNLTSERDAIILRNYLSQNYKGILGIGDEIAAADADMDVQFATDEENVQAVFREEFQKEFGERFAETIADEIQPVYDEYISRLKAEHTKAVQATKRIADEFQKTYKTNKEKYLAKLTAEEQQKVKLREQIIAEEFAKVDEQDNAKIKNYTKTMNLLPFNMTAGKLFGEGFMQTLGDYTANTANYLNSLGVSGYLLDKMKGWGGNVSRRNSLYQSTFTEGATNPSFWVNETGKMLGYMTPGIITTVMTRNPYTAAAISAANESVVMAGAKFQQSLNEGKSPDEASNDANNVLGANFPVQFAADALFFKVFAGMPKGLKAKAIDYATGSVAQGVQEIYQGGIEGSIGTNKSFAESALSKESLEGGGIATGTSLITGLPSMVNSSVREIITKVPSSRIQHIAGELITKGENRLNAASEYVAFEEDATPEQIAEFKNEVERTKKYVQEATTMGLNVQQQQVYAGLMDELNTLEQRRTSVTGTVATEVIDQQIKEKKNEIAAIVKGEEQVATIDMGGVVFTGTIPQIGEILKIEQVKEGIKDGSITILTPDPKINKQVTELVQETVKPRQEQPAPTLTFEQVEDIADELLVQMPNVPGLFGKFLQQLVEPDSRQRVVEAVIDQYNTDFETASKRYGEKVTEMVRPMVQQESNQAPAPEPVEVQQEQQPSNEVGNVAENNVTTTPAPSQETHPATQQAPATEKAQEAPKVKPTANLSFLPSTALKNKTVSIPVRVAGTGKTTIKKMQAEKVQADIKARFKELKQLINCIG